MSAASESQGHGVLDKVALAVHYAVVVLKNAGLFITYGSSKKISM
jgi:hypothetical protein